MPSATSAAAAAAAGTLRSSHALQALLADSEAPLYLVVCACRALALQTPADLREAATVTRLVLRVLCDPDFEGCLVNDPAFWRDGVFGSLLDTVGRLAPLICALSVSDPMRLALVEHVLGMLVSALAGGAAIGGYSAPNTTLSSMQRRILAACLLRLIAADGGAARWVVSDGASIPWSGMCDVLSSMTRDRDLSCRLFLAHELPSVLPQLARRAKSIELAAKVSASRQHV